MMAASIAELMGPGSPWRCLRRRPPGAGYDCLGVALQVTTIDVEVRAYGRGGSADGRGRGRNELP